MAEEDNSKLLAKYKMVHQRLLLLYYIIDASFFLDFAKKL